MRIAYLTPVYPKGSHTFVRRELRALERRGHEVLRVSIRPPEGLVDPADLEEAGRTFVCLAQSPVAFLAALLGALARAPRRFARAARRAFALGRASERGMLRHAAYLAEAALLARLFREREIEHVHVHFGTNAAKVAMLVRDLGGPRFSVAYHGPDEFDSVAGHALAEVVATAAFCTAVSRYTAAQLQRWADPRHWQRIHVVRCAVDEAWLGAARPVPEAGPFLCVARLGAQKGLAVLVDALNRLAARGVDAELVLVGDGELRGLLEERIARLGLGARVRLAGWVGEAEVRECLARARCFVLPSFAEGLPVSIMEAFALERPVIATFVAGIPELVVPGENGWLVPAGDALALAEAMAEAAAAPIERLRAMGRAGAARVRERHGLQREVARLEALLRGAATG